MDKNNKKLFKYLCCLNSLSTKVIEFLIICFTSIGIILTVIGFGVIHWKYTEKAMKIFYILSFVFFLLLIIISSYFLYSHNKNPIHMLDKNSSLNKRCLLFCCIAIFLSFFSIIIQLIIAIGVLPDLNKYNKDIDDDGDLMVSNGEYYYAIVSIIINLVIWIINFLLFFSDYIRIKYCISGSYDDYINEKKEEENYCQKPDFMVTNDKLVYPTYKKVEEKISETIEEKKEEIHKEPVSCKINNEFRNSNLYDSEQKNILKYSFKEKFNRSIKKNKNYNSVDDIHKSKNENENIDKEKYFDKYLEGYGANPFYSNFGNKSIANVSSTMNNSINPGNSLN